MTDYSILDNNTLVNLLFTEEDRLPRAAVDEFKKRGNNIIEPLSQIVREESNWNKDAPEFWAPIHAVFILGAIGAQETITPLISAVKWSEAYDVDWVFEAFPAIFGKIGTPAIEDLRKFVQDKEQDWYVRTIALHGLASIAASHTETEDNTILFIHSIFANKEENMDIRASAANVLLDFARSEYKDSLLAFCQEEKKFREKQAIPVVSFDENFVEIIFSENKKQTGYYSRDWLSFYDDDSIRIRQERWEKESEEETEEDYEDEYEEIEEPEEPPVRETLKIGRNSPCLCGSGKKYKKCCLGKR